MEQLYNNKQQNNNFEHNQVIIKLFNAETNYVELDDYGMSNVFEYACDVAFKTTGYGLSEWEFKKRSFENNILSEVYKLVNEDGSYYLLRTNKLILSKQQI